MAVTGGGEYAEYAVRFFADYDGPVHDADGNEVGHVTMTIKHPESRGLGDTIEKATSALGIKSCGGCKRRRDKLNKLIPYKRKQ